MSRAGLSPPRRTNKGPDHRALFFTASLSSLFLYLEYLDRSIDPIRRFMHASSSILQYASKFPLAMGF